MSADGADRYDRSRYTHAARDAAATSDAPASAPSESPSASGTPDSPATAGAPGSPDAPASAFSRDAAASRYASRPRRTSRLGPGAADLARGIDKRRVARVLRNVAAAAVCVVVALTLVFYCQVASALTASEDVSGAVRSAGLGEPYYVLLLGSDSRAEESDVARADSIMLVRVDESAKQVSLVSLPRDLMVDIDGYGTSKLNSALTYGGFSGVIEEVSELAGVDISYYATIYFSGFEELVDDLGGVRVEVPEGTYYDGVSVKAGKNVLVDGEEALVLARCRHGRPADQGAYAAGDYQRTLNQRNLMKAILKKILKGPVWKMPSSILAVAKCVETNMSAAKLIWVAFAMRGMDADSMYTAVAPASSQYVSGVSYEVLDDGAWAQMLARLDAGEDPNG